MLELGKFPVNKIEFGKITRWNDGLLEINRQEIEQIVLADKRISWVGVDIANRGDKSRIINKYDVMEPRIKITGEGQAYPSLVGRDPRAVGRGRTHGLTGSAVIVCVDESLAPRDDAQGKSQVLNPEIKRRQFSDMSGPGAITFPSLISNLCLTIQRPEGASTEYWHTVTMGAILRVSDCLASTVSDLTPEILEVFDTTPKDGLPGIVFVPHLTSRENYRGAYTKYGTAIYGITRAAPPWVLEPTELLDGAIAQERSWIYTNNPSNLELLKRHGSDWNYLACLAYPTNWTMEAEKQSVSSRVARIAKMMGADGALITTDVRGQRMVETMLTIEACEREGIDVVFISEEEDPEDGGAPPFLNWVDELETVTSTGTGRCDGPFPKVENVIGAREPDSDWFEEQPPVPGRYGAGYLGDNYGFGKQSYADF